MGAERLGQQPDVDRAGVLAHPDEVSVEVGGQHHRVRPEELDGPRREVAWAQIVASRPSMAEYQEKTDRVLPVLRLVRAD